MKKEEWNYETFSQNPASVGVGDWKNGNFSALG
jgi:hypothetical protein